MLVKYGWISGYMVDGEVFDRGGIVAVVGRYLYELSVRGELCKSRRRGTRVVKDLRRRGNKQGNLLNLIIESRAIGDFGA